MKDRLARMGLVLLACIGMHPVSAAELSAPAALPEFTATEQAAWVRSTPMTVADLSGKVALIHFWAFECWNCYRSFPWLNQLHASFSDQDFAVIGIHTPEFEREKDRDRLIEKMDAFSLHHPVMMDNDYAYWNALNNRYWPSWYVVDGKGAVNAVYIGEIHAGDQQARRIEKDIRKLLNGLQPTD